MSNKWSPYQYKNHVIYFENTYPKLFYRKTYKDSQPKLSFTVDYGNICHGIGDCFPLKGEDNVYIIPVNGPEELRLGRIYHIGKQPGIYLGTKPMSKKYPEELPERHLFQTLIEDADGVLSLSRAMCRLTMIWHINELE